MAGMMLIAALLMVPAEVITVDDDGPADFATIAAAIAAAAPGDVLAVQPGHYASFTVDKDLTLVGPVVDSRPRVAGTVSVIGPAHVVIAGFEFAALDWFGDGGGGILEDCSVGVWAPALDSVALRVSGVTDLIVSSCDVQAWDKHGGVGAQVDDGHIAFANCSLLGGHGKSFLFGPGGDGGTALRVNGAAAQVALAGCRVRGGDAGLGGSLSGEVEGRAGDGIASVDATVIVRGTSGDWVHAGTIHTSTGESGLDLDVSGGLLLIGGVDYDPESVSVANGGQLVHPLAPEPFLEVEEPQFLAWAGLLVHGPVGQPAFLLASVDSAQVTIPKLEAPLSFPIGNTVLVGLVTAGLDSPTQITATLHPVPEFVGLAIRVQAVFPGVASTLAPGKLVVTNPVALVERHWSGL